MATLNSIDLEVNVKYDGSDMKEAKADIQSVGDTAVKTADTVSQKVDSIFSNFSEKLKGSLGAGGGTEFAKDLNTQLEALEVKRNALSKKLAGEVGKGMNQQDPIKISGLISKLGTVENKMASLREKMQTDPLGLNKTIDQTVTQAGKQFDRIYDEYAKTIDKMNAESKKFSEMNTKMGMDIDKAVNSAADKWDKALDKFTASGGGSSSQKSNPFGNIDWSGLINGAKSTFNTLRKYATGIASMLGNIGKTISNKLLGNVTHAIKKLGELGAAFKRIMLYRAIRTIIKDIGQAFKEGIGNMYQWSNTADGVFAASMDRLATSGLYVKNSLGAMLAPAINALIPIVERLASAFITVVNAFNQFLAALTGAAFWTKAVKYPTKYAKAVGGAAGKATDALKKLGLAQMDELTILDKAGDNGGGGGGGGGGLDYSSMFENEALTDFWKKMMETDDWTYVGKLIAKKLNGIVDSVNNWIDDKFRPQAVLWTSRLATFLNGLVLDFNWEKLGTMIGNGMNAIIEAVNNFFAKFEAYKFGQGIGKTVKGWFEKVDWEGVGRYLSNKLNLLIDVVSGFFSEFVKNAGTYGEKIALAFQSWVDSIHWDRLREGIGNGLKSIADFLWGFLDNSDGSWDQFTEQFNETLSSIFRSPDLERILKALGEFINRLAESLKKLDWEAVGEAVVKALEAIDWVKLFVSVTSIMGKALLGALKQVLRSPQLLSLFAAGGGLLLLKNAAITGFTAVGTAGATALMGPLGLLLVDLAIWSNNIAKIGDYLTEKAEVDAALVEAQAREAESVVKLQSALAAKGVHASTDDINKYLDGTMSFLELTGGKFATIKDAAEYNMKKADHAVTEHTSSMKSKVGDALENVNSKVGTISGKVGSALSGMSSKLSSSLTTSANNVNNSVQGMINTIASKFGSLGYNLSSGMGSVTNIVLQQIGIMQRAINGLDTSISRASRSAGSTGAVRYATGGFPEDGFFYANHTELVGTFSNGKTAVANNAQIVEGIKAGVYDAVMSAMANGGFNANVYLDGQQITGSVVQNINGETRRTGQSPLLGV